MVAIMAAALIGFLVQDKDTEVVQLKDQSLLVGRIVKVDEKGITIELKGGGRVDRAFSDLAPFSAYKIKLARIEPSSGAAHFALGEFCLANSLFSHALAEFEKAAELDEKLADGVARKKAEVRNEDGRSKFEETKRLIAEKKYEEASKLLALLNEKYGDTEYAAEARKEMTKVADEIRKDNEQRQKDLEARNKAKEDAKRAKSEEGEKAVLTGAIEVVEDAKKQWAEGLDWEGKGNLTKADRAFKTAEAKLAAGKKTAEVLGRSPDAVIAKQGKDLDKDIEGWLVRTYYRLGRMWAAETNYTEALLWLNKGIKLAPDDALMNEVLLTITQVQIKRRSVISTPKE